MARGAVWEGTGVAYIQSVSDGLGVGAAGVETAGDGDGDGASTGAADGLGLSAEAENATREPCEAGERERAAEARRTGRAAGAGGACRPRSSQLT